MMHNMQLPCITYVQCIMHNACCYASWILHDYGYGYGYDYDYDNEYEYDCDCDYEHDHYNNDYDHCYYNCLAFRYVYPMECDA